MPAHASAIQTIVGNHVLHSHGLDVIAVQIGEASQMRRLRRYNTALGGHSGVKFEETQLAVPSRNTPRCRSCDAVKCVSRCSDIPKNFDHLDFLFGEVCHCYFLSERPAAFTPPVVGPDVIR